MFTTLDRPDRIDSAMDILLSNSRVTDSLIRGVASDHFVRYTTLIRAWQSFAATKTP